MLHALIMAGGGGTRFWPRSRQLRPKQFLALAGSSSLLQQTLERIEALVPPARSWIITGASHAAETARQLPGLPAARIVGEPCGRDTAACIGLGAALVARDDPAGVMIVMPADHVIEPAQEFRRAVQVAEQVLVEHPDALVTFGIQPTFAATGYGYIERGAETTRRQGVPIYQVASFREKPSPELAQQFLASGEHSWNSGIFVWRTATILAELLRQRPTLAAAVERIAAAWETAAQDEVLTHEYAGITGQDKTSIDYAVMENAKQVLMVQAPFQWDDVGSWLALERRHPQDAADNTVLANHLGLDTHNCVVAGDGDKLIATLGVRDLIIIQDGDAILVAHRDCEGAIKKVVDQLKVRGLEKYLLTPRTRWLGVDPGKVRLGLALSDTEHRLASPLTTYTRRSPRLDAEFFKKVIADEEVGAIVIGLPIHEDGSEGDQAKAARVFGAWLQEATGLSCVFYDERFTTFQAESSLLEAGLTSKKRKARRDRVAAQILLQTYLDASCPQ